MPPFSDDEIRRRWQLVRHGMVGTDVLVAATYHSVYYLAGIPIMPLGRPSLVVLPAHGDPTLVVPRLEAEAAARESPIPCIVAYDDDAPPVDAVVRAAEPVLRRLRPARIAYDAQMEARLLAELLRAVPLVAFADGSAVINNARIVSSPEELRLVRQAAQAVGAGIACAERYVRAGGAEAAIAERLRRRMWSVLDSSSPHQAFSIVHGATRSAAEPHRPSGATDVGGAPLAQVLCECEVWGYRAAAARCVSSFRCDASAVKAVAVAEEAFERALVSIRPGARFCDVDAAGRETFLAAGYDDLPTGSGFVYPLAYEHGGRNDFGELRAYNERRLEPGMILMLEPWARVPGVGGPRRAGMVLVTPDGHELMTP
jgi:Xaa-Pro dipeptidase